ncbi:uncharacterized protein SAPINGB_P003575 [Magnusiomyces paraingens]|uniref:LSM complex subunit LSM3 n=1 Tax=Magnusiomyces paraingens TaxID=2606893 RepID=A0A5E8BQY2_9ASCO|nr:uncharacterized protein SAPINGB_P003575 [Saprochaete ingens]VVT53441.1 unnamed protein product [Saprochaete ingens]
MSSTTLSTQPEPSTTTVSEPFDLVRLSLDEIVTVKLRVGRVLKGRLHAYDSHCNLIMSNVEETITYFEDGDEEPKSIKKHSEMMFVRGDSVILISPPTRR